MALCCIGGVCIPQTALFPVILLGLKWLAAKLAMYGLLPDAAIKYLGLQKGQSSSSCCDDDGTCSSTSKCTPLKFNAVPEAPTTVQVMEDDEDVKKLLDKEETTAVLKFTATWCMPCKNIAPVYKELATEYAAHFIEVDVDELDEIAAQFKVAVMPTFCIASGSSRVETMTGSNEAALRDFMKQNLVKRS